MQIKEIIRFIKFVGFSISAGVIQMSSFALFNELGHWPYWLSYFCALVLSVFWNFTLNRKFTFKSSANVPKAMALVLMYYCVFIPVTTFFEHYFTGTLWWNEYFATILNMLLNFVTEFLYQRYVVFGKSIDSAVKEDILASEIQA